MRHLTWLLFLTLCAAEQQPPSQRTASHDLKLRLAALRQPTPSTPPTPPPALARPDFCQPPYQAPHVMCKDGPPNCITYFTNTSFMNQSIVWVHNHYRSHLAKGWLADFPAAANMLKMRWDEELAHVAEAKGRLCTDDSGSLNIHADIINTADFPEVSISVVAQWSGQYTMPIIWRFVVRDWFDQNILFPKENIPKYAEVQGTEEFVHMAAADTYAVGCSYTRSNMEYVRKPTKNAFVYVCLYGPKAPLPGKALYYEGVPCSLCPEDTACDAPSGLCVLKGKKPGPAKPAPEVKKDGGDGSQEKVEVSVAEAVAAAVMLPIVAAVLAVYEWRHGVD
ncbi:hypothetical protein HPB50_025875 [Hyalomma asiaticum]|uniref:Uncharacterized protein n=1 Tax=Hyalomma asiaticum TaxID=266040 RepID=A0ACB7T9H5_HYAAI|nr:hypothetical protein HPB50_025875 [Hyalomma asiaticum]